MWMVDPRILCRAHLIDEHGEIHKFRHCFVKQYKMDGRMGQIDPSKMKERHDELAKEMLQRGYNHHSSYEQPDVSYLPDMSVDPIQSIRDLFGRCEDCKNRAHQLVFGEMFSKTSMEIYDQIKEVVEEIDLDE